MQKKQIKKANGFTLIEILVVIGLIAILATIVIIAINPARQFAQGRNSARVSNVNAILNAVGQYAADHKGVLPASAPAGATPVVQTEITAALCNDIMPTYIPSLPTDPQSDFNGGSVTACSDIVTVAPTKLTAYTIGQDATGRITICAPKAAAEASLPGSTAICVTR